MGIFTGVHALDHKEAGRRIGKEAYVTLTDKQKAVIAHGMFPVEVMQSIEKSIRRSVVRAVKKKWGLDVPSEVVKKELVEGMKHGVCLGLLEAARKAGKLIV